MFSGEFHEDKVFTLQLFLTIIWSHSQEDNQKLK